MAQLASPKTHQSPTEQARPSKQPVETLTLNDLDPSIRDAFPKLKAFNNVQRAVANTVLQTDNSIVVNAPTGSGKTVILELAMLKLSTQAKDAPYRIVYLAPTRSLCAEKFQDWKGRFAPHGLSCIQFDGDNLVEDVAQLSHHRLILSTPEKWEVFTRHWDDQSVACVLRPIRLCLIDEIQIMNDSDRGANLELVISRMKYIDSRLRRGDAPGGEMLQSIRFIAVSACIPNVDDFARWLASEGRTVVPYTFDETNRTTRIERHVLSFPSASNPYKFELNLNYKLPAIIEQYSAHKPTLVFCTSRRSVESTAKFLANRSPVKRAGPAAGSALAELAGNLANRTLQECVAKGVAYHHAGLLHNDRNQIEAHFRAGHLAVLCCTSTLCMGVNLPAYLVVVKSTCNHTGKEYTDNYVLQMVGRAGRAEFSEDGVAVILTTDGNASRYQRVVTETAPIESQLRRKLPELLNSEIAHGIIYDQPAVMEWIRSTFFYVRAQTNPSHYQLAGGRLLDEQIEKLCCDTIESLEANELVVRQRPNAIVPSACGRLMARNQLSFPTLQLLQQGLKGRETLDEMLVLITRAHEFGEFTCRQGEKKILNTLNGPTISASFCDGGDDVTGGVRFRWPRRICTTGAKVYCLVQAVFGNLPINDHGLHQEAAKMVTVGGRIARFVIGLLTAKRDHPLEGGCFRALVSAATLLQCFQTKLWEDSPYVAKQLGQIGPRLARHLAERGKGTFAAIRHSDPREIECIVKKPPPVGNDIVNFVTGLPEFTIKLCKVEGAASGQPSFTCTVAQNNTHYDPEIAVSFCVLVGDSSNRVLLHVDNCTVESIPVMGCTWPLPVRDDSGAPIESLSAHLICHEWCGLDCSHTLWLVEQPPSVVKHRQTAITNFFPNTSLNESAIGGEKIALPSALELSRLRWNETNAHEVSVDLPNKLPLPGAASRMPLNTSRWNESCNESVAFRTSVSNTTFISNNSTKLADTSNDISAMLDSRVLQKPLRSILKPFSTVPPRKPHAFAPLNISHSSLMGNSKQNHFQQAAKRIVTPVAIRPDELEYIFQPDRCTLNFTLCSPVDDIVDCLQRYTIFRADCCTPPDVLVEVQVEPAVRVEERKRKNFDLGKAADVFVSDEE
ncbi:probable ATP-dependent DNA helicase HFM1 [Anopheles gambiae]|uniref:probable ATP-dependent DNA helicase HFM1 n=1 Tax=Anopheles gambiae TaxID=7165 RepID=UPI002AC8BE49|nr:probable ATP-dependent DNA helicase HFM1 [Anopheles gambiae]